MLSVEEAQKRILAAVQPLGKETIPIPRSLGRILAEEITSHLDYPPWDASAMDGYAVRLSDTVGVTPNAPSRLRIIEQIPAGVIPQKKVLTGTASKIMTGAPVPKGADAIAIVEDTTEDGEDVLISKSARTDYIRYQGEVVHQGDVVLKKGVAIRPYEIAMMASLGITQVLTYRRPRVAILSTGNELVDLHEACASHQIYNSNGYGLAAQVEEAGGVPILLGIAKDTRSDLLDKLKGGSDADFILISGGVSAGDYDFVKELFASSREGFWKVAIKPGKPLAFGAIFGKPAWGLPGNPVSAMVTFNQFVRPALLHAQGSQNLFQPLVDAMLMKEITNNPGRRHYVRGCLSIKNGVYQVLPVAQQDSGNLLSLVQANALIVLGEEMGNVSAGTHVTVQILGAVP